MTSEKPTLVLHNQLHRYLGHTEFVNTLRSVGTSAAYIQNICFNVDCRQNKNALRRLKEDNAKK